MLREKGVDVKSYMEKNGLRDSRVRYRKSDLWAVVLKFTVAQHTNGYQTIANNGVYHQKHVISKIESI